MFKKFFRKKVTTGDDEMDSMIRKYNRSRTISDPKYLCHAPFNNMYINTEGHIAACWLTFNNPVKYTEDLSLKKIWRDGKLKALRDHIKKNDLSYQCQTCEKHIKEGNFVNVLARAYDNEYVLTDFPSIIEFELDNTCNLACTMCNGMLSSTIRRERDKLPKLESPYGEKFLQELEEFIPHLKEARFNGGEPFLIKNYYRIWDMIWKLNPECKIVIATNGTVLTSKVKDYLTRGNFHFNISMDGFSKEIYESVRLKGDRDKLMENFKWFQKYCKDNDRTLCIMINPMRQNWWEMPDFLNWVNEYNVHLWFNSIIKPADQAIWSLPSEKLQEVYDTLTAAEINPFSGGDRGIYKYNVKTYKNLVEQQIKTWLDEAVEREKRSNEVFDLGAARKSFLNVLKEHSANNEEYHELRSKFEIMEKDLSLEEREVMFRSIEHTDPQFAVEALKGKGIDDLMRDVRKTLSGGA